MKRRVWVDLEKAEKAPVGWKSAEAQGPYRTWKLWKKDGGSICRRLKKRRRPGTLSTELENYEKKCMGRSGEGWKSACRLKKCRSPGTLSIQNLKIWKLMLIYWWFKQRCWTWESINELYPDTTVNENLTLFKKQICERTKKHTHQHETKQNFDDNIAEKSRCNIKHSTIFFILNQLLIHKKPVKWQQCYHWVTRRGILREIIILTV